MADQMVLDQTLLARELSDRFFSDHNQASHVACNTCHWDDEQNLFNKASMCEHYCKRDILDVETTKKIRNSNRISK